MVEVGVGPEGLPTVSCFGAAHYSSSFSFPFPDQVGCSYCNGLGHRITDCPKLASLQKSQTASIGRKDYLSASAADY